MTSLVSLGLAMTLVWGVNGQAGLPQIEEEHLLRTSFETPHVKWGKPWYAGTTKTLMFCVGKYEYARDAVEMLQRFDMDITPVYFRLNRKVLHFTTANVDREVDENPPDSDGIQRVRRLLRQKWDLFLFGNIDPDVLPPELQYYIYSQVAEGAGILCIGPAPERVMTAGREMKEPPNLFPLGVKFWTLPSAAGWVKEGARGEELERALVHAYRLGKGRGVHFALPNALTVTPNLPASPENINELEYWYALAGELGIWAAGRDVDLAKAAGGRKVVVMTRWRRLDGAIAADWREGATVGDKTRLLFPEPQQLQGGAGDVVGETIVRIDGKAAGFGAWATETRAAGNVAVEAIFLNSDFCEPGEEIAGTVTLAEADYSGCLLRMETRDAWGRVLTRADYRLAADAQQQAFSLPTSGDCSIYMRVEASIWKGGVQLTAPKAAEFRVTQRRRGIFHQVMWDAPTSAVGYWAMLRLRQLGYDVILGGVKSTVALADMPLIPYTTRLMEEHDEHGIMKPCCWNDIEKSERWIDEIVARQDAARKHGVYAYSLGDETTTKGCCISEFCLAKYREYLKEQYGTIDALNKSWATNYASFDQVELSKPDDNYEKTAFQEANYARWFDRQAYSQWNYLNLNARFGHKYKTIDPQAVTGFEGAGGFGDDIEGIVRTNGFYNPYPDLGDEVLRSVAPKGYIRGNWIGYQRDAEPLLYWYWRIIMNGCPCVFWWRWDGIGLWHGYLAPDFETYAATEEMDRDTAIVRQGLGDLLIRADREDDGIAVLYCVAAAQAERLPDSKEYGGVKAAHEAWVNLTKGAGLGFRYITERQVEGGELRQGVKVLVLPLTRAISDKVAEEIGEFVRRGGKVIADLRPGEFTGHLAKREKPVLDELFGVEHGRGGKPEMITVEVRGIGGDEEAALSVGRAHVERNVRLTTGKAAAYAGETPLLVTNRVGEGQAILLNFAMADVAATEMTEAGPPARRFVEELYRACGVKPEVTVASDDPQVVLNTGAWRAGKLRVYGVQMRNYRYQGGRYTLRCATPMHVYDLRDGKYLGLKKEVTLPAWRTRFLVLAPSPIAPVAASTDKTRYAPGDTVVLRLSRGKGNPDGLYGVGVRLYDPSGMEQLWARRCVVVERNEELQFPLGLNAAGGWWKLVVRDLTTGQAANIQFTVSDDNPCCWPGCYAVK